MDASSTVELYVRTCLKETRHASDVLLADVMLIHGCTGQLADQATRFVPLAFAREFLKGAGVSFQDEYWCFSPDGSIKERGNLTDNDIYVKARELAPSRMSKEVISNLVSRSAEAQAVYTALKAGSKPQNLKLGPVIFFSEEPSEEGRARAQEQISASLSATKPSETNKPWWKRW